MALVRRPCTLMGKTTRYVAVMQGAYRPTESKTLCMRKSSMYGNRESLEATEQVPSSVRLGKVSDHKPSMYATGQSDRPIVPQKLSNKGCKQGRPAIQPAETAEGRGLTKGNLF